MRVVCNHPVSQSKYSGLPWYKVDWTKQDIVIAQELGVTNIVVRNWRLKLGKPRSPWKWMHRPGMDKFRKIDRTQLDKANWKERTDADLGREWNITRERVRQLRLEYGEPCANKWFSQKRFALEQWIKEHRAEIENRPVNEVLREMPPWPTKAYKITILQQSGVPVDWTPRPVYKYTRNQWNWQLPNIMLQMIWRTTHNYPGNIRSQHALPKPVWSLDGFSKDCFDKEFLEAVRAEIQSAKAQGVQVPEAAINSYLEQRKQNYERCHM